MKHVILTTIIILLGTFALRAESQLITQADSAYNADDFRQAADMYLNVIQQEGPSAKLYYNLGNTYYRLGEMGNAVIAYERALRLDPSDKASVEHVSAMPLTQSRPTPIPTHGHG